MGKGYSYRRGRRGDLLYRVVGHRISRHISIALDSPQVSNVVHILFVRPEKAGVSFVFFQIGGGKGDVIPANSAVDTAAHQILLRIVYLQYSAGDRKIRRVGCSCSTQLHIAVQRGGKGHGLSFLMGLQRVFVLAARCQHHGDAEHKD